MTRSLLILLATLPLAACTVAHQREPASDMLAAALHDDRDGVDGADDACPRAAEDRDGVADHDGCPEHDNDADGFVDVRDQCPGEAGGEPWVVDSLDGCPTDRDGDGIFDSADACIDDPENFNGYEDEDGCPDIKVEVTAEKITFDQKVYFELDSSELKERSFPLLDRIAEVMNDHLEVTSIEVAGHTDAQGKAAYNRKLSQARAESVVAALVERGVAADRLVPRGYGLTRPVLDEATEEAYAVNRRVELVILARDDGAAE